MIKLIVHPNHELEQTIELESRTILIGRSDENDLTIDDPSIASHHARVEKRGDEFIVRDLSKQGLLVDGEQVGEATIAVGSIITIGDVEILFKGETPLAGEAEPFPEAGALVTTHPGVGQPGAYLPTETFIQPAHLDREHAISSTLPLISFICGMLGPLLLGLGWLLGIILGFVSLANIRRRGGLLKDKRMAAWGVNLGFAWVVLAFGLGAWYSLGKSVKNTVRRNEHSARRALAAVCVTQYYARYGCFFDTNDNGAFEYAALDELESLRYSAMPDLRREPTGYELIMLRANEDGFLCYARPKAYGRTGRDTYAIDETGILRGKDLHGVDLADYDRELPRVSQGDSVFDTSGEQIARDLVEAAKKAAADNDYARAMHIVQAARETFPLTDAVKKVLDAVGAEVGPQIVEIRSIEEYNRARALIEGGEIVRALEVLIAAEQAYPTSSYIVKIREQIALIKEEHFKELEAAAEQIYNNAQRLELAGDFTTAKQEYMKIREQYSMTTYGQDIQEQIDKIEAKIREVEAGRYVAQLRTLSADTDYVDMVRIVELLKRRYADTDEFERNYEAIELAEHTGRAYSEAVQGIRHFQNEQYESALAAFDKAVAEHADIQPRIKPYLEECYYAVGMSSFKRRDYRTALAMFERYRRLAPRQSKLDDRYLMHAYYEVGKLDYQQASYEAAEKRLFVCSGQFDTQAEFNYIYGSVLVELGEHKRAIEYFTRYFKYGSTDVAKRYYSPSLRKRGYSESQLAAQLEDEVKELVMANPVYHPLIVAEQEQQPAEEEAEDDGKDDEEKDDTDEDDGLDVDFGGFGQRLFDSGRSPGRNGDLGSSGTLLAQTEQEDNEGNGETGDDEAAEPPPPPEPAFKRILSVIIEVQGAHELIRQEFKAAKGNEAAKSRVEVKRGQMIELFQQKRANLKIQIDRENTAKREIFGRLEYAAGYLANGVSDLKAVNRIATPNRDLERVIAKLDYKRRMFAAARTHLVIAYNQEVKSQRDAYALLDIAIKEFTGWPSTQDIGRTLRGMFLMKPGTEQVAEGLRLLLKGFDVETDLEVILRSGGEPIPGT